MLMGTRKHGKTDLRAEYASAHRVRLTPVANLTNLKSRCEGEIRFE